MLKNNRFCLVSIFLDIDSWSSFACWKSTMETPEQCVKLIQIQQSLSVVNFEQISHIALLFPLLILNY